MSLLNHYQINSLIRVRQATKNAYALEQKTCEEILGLDTIVFWKHGLHVQKGFVIYNRRGTIIVQNSKTLKRKRITLSDIHWETMQKYANENVSGQEADNDTSF